MEEVIPQAEKGKKLLKVVESWLKEDYELRQKTGWAPVQTSRTPTMMPSKHMAFFR